MSLQGRELAALQQAVFHVGNSGESGAGNTPARCWNTLLDHLSGSTIDLGWDAVVALAAMQRVSFLVCSLLVQTTVYEAGTQAAKVK